MADTVQYRIGAQASCSDGSCGHVSRVVLDPVARAITHVVVEPGHGGGAAQLVPVEFVEVDGQTVQLRLHDRAVPSTFEPAEENAVSPR